MSNQTIKLSLNNQKGGVGKTSSAVSLAAIYAQMGLRVLLIDNDPQANASSQLGFGPKEVKALGKRTISELYLEEQPLSEVVTATAYDNLYLVPSSLRLAEVEMNLPGMGGNDQRLSTALSEEGQPDSRWDLIVMDSPPNLGKLSANATTACTHFLVPTDALWGLDSIAPLLSMVKQNSRYYKTSNQLAGIFFTLTDHTTITKLVREEATKLYGENILATQIPRAKEGREAPAYNKPIPCYAPKSKLAQAYFELAEEVARRIGLALPATVQVS